MPRLSTVADHPIKPHFRVAARRARASRVSIPRFRLLRFTMIMAFLLFGLKSVEVYQGGRNIQLQFQQAYAAEEPAEKPEAASKEMAEDGVKDEVEVEQDESLTMASLKDTSNDPVERGFTAIEISLLQSLRERRKEIEVRASELDLKERLLEGTELRINDKLAEMKALETKVTMLLERYSKQEESHIRSLVKIYESMKPKSAAAIFNELELPILLEVIDQMSERKVAPVLAAMDPMKARDVTSDLAEMRRLQAEGINR